MKEVTQIDNPVHYNQRREREKALKALDIAKSMNRPVVFLRKGETPEPRPTGTPKRGK